VDRRPPPPEPPRRRRATVALERLLLAALAVHLALGLAAAIRGPPPRVERIEPLAVDLATDGAPRLRLLPGIGPARAAAIDADRRAHGPVPRLGDLDRVPGIGPGIVRRLREARGVRAVVGPGR
jgi:DNA uptake protein ComE-like DNA-binding protein